MRQIKETLAAVLPGSGHALIDVRSETEFEQSAVPGFISLPLLYQNERHQVGLCYKSEGQAAAIKLGHELVDPHRPQRVKAWIDAIKESHTQQGIIMCWRGGLRSQIATQWIQEAGYEARQLPGGYKQIRQYFLTAFQNPPPLLILAGLTGSGKTELLREFQDSNLDLEAAAQHRGSAFGELLAKQPTQTQFENKIGLSLFNGPLLVEDESRMLGRLCIPETLFNAIQSAPIIFLEVPHEERLRRVFAEYVTEPLNQGLDYHALEKNLLTSLEKIKRRLDKNYAVIKEQINLAFKEPSSFAVHASWIDALLVKYYDPLYSYAAEKKPRKLVLRAGRQTCRAWLQANLRDLC